MSSRNPSIHPASTSILRRGVAALATMAALTFGGLSLLPPETAAAAGVARNNVVLTSSPTVASSTLGEATPSRKR